MKNNQIIFMMLFFAILLLPRNDGIDVYAEENADEIELNEMCDEVCQELRKKALEQYKLYENHQEKAKIQLAEQERQLAVTSRHLVEAKWQREESKRQLEESRKQQEESKKFHKENWELLNEQKQLQKRFSQILATWEKQQKQYQRYLDRINKVQE